MIESLTAAGVPSWVLVVLVGLGIFGVPAAGSERAATFPGLLGAGARWWQGRKARRREEIRAEAAAAAEPTASELLDDKVIARMERRYSELEAQCARDAQRADERAARQDAAIAAQAADIAELRENQRMLEGEVTATKARFFVLLGYTRRVMDVVRKLDPDHPLPSVPSELSEWLGHG